VATSWPSVRDTCARLGWGFDPWQDGAGRLILSLREDGQYAADTIVLSIPRQVGKTYLIAAIIFALCLLRPGLTVIWTAHRKTTAAETFAQFDGMAQRPKVAPHVRQVLRGKGDEKILFGNGSRILFGARESGFGRGMTDVDVLVWDEGQILGEGTLEDMAAAQNVAKNPLTFVMGTPPRPKDAGEFFTLMRREALDGESEGTLYVEFSADRGCDPMDRKQWAIANPSFPGRTTERAMLRLRKKLKSDDSWRREALGVWDDTAADDVPLTVAQWQTRRVDSAPASWPLVAVGLDMSPKTGRLWTSVAARSPEGVHVELLPANLLDLGADEAVAWLWKRCGRRLPVVMWGDSGATVLEAKLLARGMKVYSLNLAEQGRASTSIARAVVDETVTHLDDPVLEMCVGESRKDRLRDAGQWKFARAGDMASAPLLAAASAHYGAIRWAPKGSSRSDNGRRAVVL
jgi:phage terminase large subunit-like protein